MLQNGAHRGMDAIAGLRVEVRPPHQDKITRDRGQFALQSPEPEGSLVGVAGAISIMRAAKDGWTRVPGHHGQRAAGGLHRGFPVIGGGQALDRMGSGRRKGAACDEGLTRSRQITPENVAEIHQRGRVEREAGQERHPARAREPAPALRVIRRTQSAIAVHVKTGRQSGVRSGRKGVGHGVPTLGQPRREGCQGKPVTVKVQIEKQNHVRAQGQKRVTHHQHIGRARANVAQQQARPLSSQSGMIDCQPDHPLCQCRRHKGQHQDQDQAEA